MYRTLALSLLLSSCTSLFAQASERLEQAAFAPRHEILERKNQALLNYLWLDVYAAAFYVEPGVTPQQAVEQPGHQRLELYYFRAIDRADLIKAAWITLERQHAPAALEALRDELKALHDQFRDIAPGDRYALDFSPGRGLSLERNGVQVFTSPDPALAKAYLGIWLRPDGLSDELRASLLAGP